MTPMEEAFAETKERERLYDETMNNLEANWLSRAADREREFNIRTNQKILGKRKNRDSDDGSDYDEDDNNNDDNNDDTKEEHEHDEDFTQEPPKKRRKINLYGTSDARKQNVKINDNNNNKNSKKNSVKNSKNNSVKNSHSQRKLTTPATLTSKRKPTKPTKRNQKQQQGQQAPATTKKVAQSTITRLKRQRGTGKGGKGVAKTMKDPRKPPHTIVDSKGRTQAV